MAAAWGHLLRRVGFHRIIASDLGRTRQTATLINQTMGCPLSLDPRLREIDWGAWTGRSLSILRQQDPGRLRDMERRGWAFQPPGGERRDTLYRRARSALLAAAQTWPGEWILVVTHEGVLKCLLYAMMGRHFLPEEPALLKTRHLHTLICDGEALCIWKINALALDNRGRGEEAL
jgi:probable phosphoglycerate mutase